MIIYIYFPKIKRGAEEHDADRKYEDEDVYAVTQIFKTVADSVIKKKGRWQAIILDHADKSIYGNINGVYEVEEWRGGKKLIPTEWYE